MKIDQSYDPSIVLTSYAIAFLGSYVAICLCEQLRSSYLHGLKNNWLTRSTWLIAIGSSLGGVGIWCMHFIGMSALTLKIHETGQKIQMGYHGGESIASLIVVIVFTSIATAIASNDYVFAKTKLEILEMFVSQAHRFSMAEVKKTKNSRVIWLIATRKLIILILGGLVAAGGVCIMHYIGMDAMEFDHKISIKWNPGLVFASVLIAVVAATAAFWILFRFLSIFPGMESLRLASAAIMGVAVCGMHYTGMFAAEFEFVGSDANLLTKNHISMDTVIPVILSAFLVLWILIIYVLYDLRRLIVKYRNYISSGHNAGFNSHAANPFSVFEKMSDGMKSKIHPNDMVSSKGQSFVSFSHDHNKSAAANAHLSVHSVANHTNNDPSNRDTRYLPETQSQHTAPNPVPALLDPSVHSNVSSYLADPLTPAEEKV